MRYPRRGRCAARFHARDPHRVRPLGRLRPRREVPMWHAVDDEVPGAHARRFALSAGGGRVSYADVLRLWAGDATFRTYFTTLLAAVPFRAFKWETPAVTTASVSRPF